MVLLEGGGIHRDEHVAAVAGGMYAFSDAHLEARHTAERPLRGTDFSRIVRECRHLVAQAGRHIGKDIAGKLHSVAGIT